MWDIHRRLPRRKGGNGFGCVPLELTDFDAFQRLQQVTLSPVEWELIELVDDLYVKFNNSPPRDGEKES